MENFCGFEETGRRKDDVDLSVVKMAMALILLKMISSSWKICLPFVIFKVEFEFVSLSLTVNARKSDNWYGYPAELFVSHC